MPPGITEHLDQEVAGAVRDLRLVGEPPVRGHVHGHLHDSAYPIQGPELSSKRRKRLESAPSGRLRTRRDIELGPELARPQEIAVCHRNLPRDIRQTPGDDDGHVGGDWRGRRWELDPQFAETAFGAHDRTL